MSDRKTNYSTASVTGMEFIANRWVFAGDKGYRVRPDESGTFNVYSYNAAGERVVGTFGMGLTEDGAHELAARLARTTPHPKPQEV